MKISKEDLTCMHCGLVVEPCDLTIESVEEFEDHYTFTLEFECSCETYNIAVKQTDRTISLDKTGLFLCLDFIDFQAIIHTNAILAAFESIPIDRSILC